MQALQNYCLAMLSNVSQQQIETHNTGEVMEAHRVLKHCNAWSHWGFGLFLLYFGALYPQTRIP